MVNIGVASINRLIRIDDSNTLAKISLDLASVPQNQCCDPALVVFAGLADSC